MRKTLEFNNNNEIAVNITKLQEMLCVGRNTAERVGRESNAVFYIGKRKMFNVKKVQAYIDKLSEDNG